MYLSKFKIVIASTIAFIFLNLFENIIHFSIGRNVENKNEPNLQLTIPGGYDFIKIIVIMTIFSILQGLFTYNVYRFI